MSLRNPGPGRWLGLLSFFCALLVWAAPAWAKVDPYVSQYLQVLGDVELPLDGSGKKALFSPEQISQGKRLFESSCLNCHVGGTTLPNPTVSLSLRDLQRAKPRRDTIASLMEFQRDPIDAAGDEVECRRVSASWMSDEQLKNLAAFVLRSAQVAPGWGSNPLLNG